MHYTCFVIGDGILLIDCIAILRQEGFQIKGVVSQDAQIRGYCDKDGLRYVDSVSTLTSVLSEEPFDFLFSIANKYILPETILRLPRFQTINYHNGPLPAYAGVHATFWALVNGEKTHGITWHVVDAGIDTGPIIRQSLFPIDPRETSVSLNIKSYTAAVDSFQELVDDIVQDRLTFQPQNSTQRSYYARKKRPDLLINWSQPAVAIDRLHRALNFGFHPNPFGYLKIWAGNGFVLVKEVTVTATVARQPPGTVEAILPDQLLVATGDCLLSIGLFQTPDGAPVSIAAFCEQAGLAEGHRLPQPEPAVVQGYKKADARCARYQPYWVDKLTQYQPSTLPWPTLPESPNKQPVDVVRIDIRLPTAVNAALEPKNSSDSRTNSVVTALLVTLARLTNQPSVSVGYQSAESAQIAADTAGLFADCLPFSVEFDWEAGFEQAVTRIRQEQVVVEKHLTFAQEIVISQPVLQSVAQELRLNGFPIVICRNGVETDHPLSAKALTVVLPDDGAYRVVFNPGVWSSHWVADFVNRWMILLENVVGQPDQPIKSVPLLTEAEKRWMLIDWNATATPYPRDQTVHQLVEEQAQLRPQASALHCGDVVLTYAQLNQQANQLARYLQKQGITTDTLVGLCTERSPNVIVSMLAILKAGGAYVPLDPNYPAARLNELITQTGVQYIITRKALLDRLPVQRSYILLDDDQPLIAQQSTENLNSPAQAEQLAYVLFTSGSTGRPKGVAIPHRGIVRTVRNTNYMRLDETVCMLVNAPLAFDASTVEIWGGLVNGGRLVLITESPPSLETIRKTIEAQAVNTAFFTTALFNVLVDSIVNELPTLTQLSTGGEAASAEHVLRAKRQMPNCELINGYGPTESTTFASYYNMSTNSWETSSVPIGTPVSNTQLYIVDSFLNPMPVGVPGELVIGGDGLAREYINQPELTKQKFVPDPFSGRPGSRLYRTGDRARYLAEGTIEFLGRQDDQLKIRGYRIEPGEIEQVLCQHPTVAMAVVLGEVSPTGMKRLVAYVVPKSGAAIDPKTLRAFLKTKVPDHLIPNVLMPLSSIPLTTNGKVDKAKLPPASGSNHLRQSDSLTSTEMAMKPLWASVLNLSDLNAGDHFFESGGNSLMAIQLIARIVRQFGLRLSMNDIFTHPTLRELSAYVDQLPRQDVSITGPSSSVIRSASHLPLSFAQNRLWIIEQLYALESVYNVPIILRIQGTLDLLALQESLNEIIRRHEILRTTFGHTDGLPFQQIGPAFSVTIPVSNQIGKTPQTLNQWIIDEGSRPFDLTEGPLVRASIAHIGENSWLFVLVFHHIIYDGLSTRVLASELEHLYPSFVRNQPVSLPQLPIQYADYVRWQADHDKPETLKREREYWKTQLANVPPLLNLPTDKPRPATQSFAGADYSFSLPDELWQQVKTGLQKPATTVFLRLLAAFAVWLHRIAKTNDIVIGIPVAGRNRPELDALIGFFVNTVVLRLEVSPDLTFRQLLRTVRQGALDAYDHQSLPFEQVVEEIKPPRTLAYSPVVQVVFSFQEDNAQYWKLDELAVEEVQFDKNTAKFDLQLTCRETPEGLVGTFNYRVDLFNEQTVGQMAETFLQVLEQLVTQPDQPIAHLHGADTVSYSLAQHTHPQSTDTVQVAEPEPAPQELDSSLVNMLELIWSRLLEVPAIGLDDDFFELGGHSLLAVQMTAAIQDQTDYKLPITGVFANPTIRQLTTYLKTTQADVRWQSLVPVNAGKPQGDRRAIYFVHPLSGDISYVYQLAPYIGNKQPVYGLRAVGLDGVTKPLTTVEEMAAYYVQLLIRHQPDGPFSLAGYSLGGTIAFEMARQLKRMGRDVKLVVLIDSYPLNPDPENHTKLPIRQLLPHYYHYWRSLPKQPTVLLPVLRRKLPWVGQYLFTRFWQSVYRKQALETSKPSETDLTEPPNPLRKIFLQANSTYSYKPYDGSVVFLRVAKNDPFAANLNKTDFGWGRYARKGVEVHQLIGRHQSLFGNPATIEQIATIIRSYLTADDLVSK